jgi:hypothetical protein
MYGIYASDQKHKFLTKLFMEFLSGFCALSGAHFSHPHQTLFQLNIPTALLLSITYVKKLIYKGFSPLYRCCWNSR